MRHFPVFLDTRHRTIVVSGGGECAVAKLRLLLKTEAHIRVFSEAPEGVVTGWAEQGRITLIRRPIAAGDLDDALLLYAANDRPDLDRAAVALARRAGVKALYVDNLNESDFITPAIVDRDPVTVAIGTEGTAPVLARRIKADTEAALGPEIGILAREAQGLRGAAAGLSDGRARRLFWDGFFNGFGPRALKKGVAALRTAARDALHGAAVGPREGHVIFVGAGPGDPELLTLRARRALHDADVVLHDGLVPGPIIELARREAEIIEVGKRGFGPSWRQEDITKLLIEKGRGAVVVRLKSGDSGVFGRLEEETEGLIAAGIGFSVVPGITAASAAAAEMGVSLTRRGRNSSVRFLTGHDLKGFAEQDWHGLARPGAVAAIYMGKAAARFVRGRLMIHGAPATTPVTVVFNASRPDQAIHGGALGDLPDLVGRGDGPAVLMLGLHPSDAAGRINENLHDINTLKGNENVPAYQ